MDKFKEAEKELAELLGWTELGLWKALSQWHGNNPKTGIAQQIPRWTQDNAAAFELMTEHEINLTWYNGCVGAEDSDGVASETHMYLKYFDSKESAMRYAIVQAVIAKLKG